MHEEPSSASNYWQLRLVVSWQRNGTLTWSLSGKQEHERWQDMHHLRTGTGLLGHEAEGTIAEGLESLERVLERDLLPRD